MSRIHPKLMRKPSALHLLNTVFGHAEFRGAQEAIVSHLAAGGDALVLMATGGGKSLCYQLPALLREGTALVVSPLIALMQDQVAALKQLGVRAAFLNSTLDATQSRAVRNDFSAGKLDLLYVAPERLVMDSMLEQLSQMYDESRLALFAIDEAHCVSQWGHDFRPEYLQLSLLHERFPGVPRIALTATADPQTRDEIIRRLQLEDARVFLSSFDRPNIRYSLGAGAWMPYGLGDVVQLRRLPDQSEGSEESRRVSFAKLDARPGLWEPAGCRRVRLLGSFGEESVAGGNCDPCLEPPQTWD